MNIIEKIKQFLKVNKDTIESLAAIVTFFGIGYVGLEYHTQQKISRQEKSFELYQQFNEEQFLKSRNKLTKAYYEMRENNPDLFKSSQNYRKAMESVWEDNNAEIISIKKFFEQVAKCVKKELCDEEAARVLFETEAQEFWQTHYQFFNDERTLHNDTNIAKILEEFFVKTRSEKDQNKWPITNTIAKIKRGN